MTCRSLNLGNCMGKEGYTDSEGAQAKLAHLKTFFLKPPCPVLYPIPSGLIDHHHLPCLQHTSFFSFLFPHLFFSEGTSEWILLILRQLITSSQCSVFGAGVFSSSFLLLCLCNLQHICLSNSSSLSGSCTRRAPSRLLREKRDGCPHAMLECCITYCSQALQSGGAGRGARARAGARAGARRPGYACTCRPTTIISVSMISYGVGDRTALLLYKRGIREVRAKYFRKQLGFRPSPFTRTVKRRFS